MKTKQENRSVYAWSLALAGLTFPLIWLGGLVTTHDAGMAVPDWPGTYGYNLFLYPLSTWLFGPFDLLVEHGHRLLASVVGLLAIILCFVAWRFESRSWVRRLCWLLLGAVISQGLLGGIRVLLDERVVALIHGVGGPLVFSLACWIVMVNSADWKNAESNLRASGLRWATRGLFLLSICQLVLGAHLRHALPTWRPTLFVSFVHTHLLLALLITLFVILSTIMVFLKPYREHRALRLPALLLVGVVFAQVALGFGTWISNYALPWPELNAFFANYTIAGRGFWESMIINGHQATGSLLIVFSLWLLCRVERRCIASRFANKSDQNEVIEVFAGSRPNPVLAGPGVS